MSTAWLRTRAIMGELFLDESENGFLKQFRRVQYVLIGATQ
jgi:hypothetical protein